MKASIGALAAASLLATSASALHYEKRDNPKAVHVPLERAKPSEQLRERLRLRRRGRMTRRAGTVGENIDNIEDGTLYFLNVTMGTPAQSLRFHVDTGSSDLWANVANSTICTTPANELEEQGILPCSASGTFDADKSSTYQFVNNDFFIQYADTTGASGQYGTDDLTFGGATIKAQQFGLGLQSNSSEGVMGIGYTTLEASIETESKTYANVPQQLVQQGLINTNAYSLWLNDINTNEGSILFGGVDTAKFTGSLVTVPIVPNGDVYQEMVIGLSGVSVNSNGKSTQVDTQAVPVLLDSGSTLMYLPTNVAENIYSALGVKVEDGTPVVSCSLAKSTTQTLDFNFSGQTISVSMAELVIDEGMGNECLFGIESTDEAPFTLGDSFIRNAYLVYDLDANTISLAQANYNPGSSNVHEITNGTNGVPSAVQATSTAAVTLNGGGQGYNGGPRENLSAMKNAAAHPTPAVGVRAWGAIAAGAAGVMAAI